MAARVKKQQHDLIHHKRRFWAPSAILPSLLAAVLAATVGVGTGKAQENSNVNNNVIFDDDGDALIPGSVRADLQPPLPRPRRSAPDAIFPDFKFPGRLGAEAWRDALAEDYGLRLGFSYQQLYQYASETIPGSPFNTANGGWASFEAIWTPVNRGSDREGRVVLRLGWRGEIGNNAVPAQFGGLNLGAAWSNYEFTDWDGGVKVEDLFWEQELGENFSFRIGNMIPTAVYNFSRFKDARVSFTSSPFAFHEVIPQPTFGLGASFRWNPVPDNRAIYVVGTVNDMNGDPAANGLDWSTVKEGQFFYGLEVGRRWRRENGEFDHIHVNLFYADKRSTRNPDTSPNEAGWGLRVYGEKQIGRFVGFGGYTYNTAKGGGISATFQKHVATAGIAYLNPFQIRGELAFGAMFARPFENIFPGSGQRDQYGFEVYWRAQVTPNLTVTPGVQVVYDPSFNPTVDSTVVPSIKFRVVF